RAMIVSHQLAPFLRVETRRNLTRAHQVAEQHRQVPTLSDDLSRLDRRSLGSWSADRRVERSAALTAELCRRRIVRTALRTAARKSNSAFGAELPASWILEPAA